MDFMLSVGLNHTCIYLNYQVIIWGGANEQKLLYVSPAQIKS